MSSTAMSDISKIHISTDDIMSGKLFTKEQLMESVVRQSELLETYRKFSKEAIKRIDFYADKSIWKPRHAHGSPPSYDVVSFDDCEENHAGYRGGRSARVFNKSPLYKTIKEDLEQ